ncbi:MAG TPA: winged helix DNA-binding domain-containing protein [Micromonosporaceae bacterium]|nr:winged helix DNA-binding domain-containing protein [Micromonosporaceae bacterium]
MKTLARRALNRTLLERQMLVQRTSQAPLKVIEHLVAMQAQEPNWPYVGLWTRIAGFKHDDLTSLLDERSVVRSTMLRTTQHLASSNDFGWLRPVVQPSLDRTVRSPYFAEQTTGLDLAELTAIGRELLGDRTLTRREFGKLVAERFPDRNGRIVAGAVELQTALVHPPPSSTWGSWGNRPVSVAPAEFWLGRPMESAPSAQTMILRYLASYGPASVMDIQAWAGLTKLREVVQEMRSQLRVYRDENGKELFDLPEAPLSDPDLPVPVRFMPAYDNLILSHADRARVISDEDRKQVITGSLVRPTFLVDGFVHGTWTLKDSTLLITPYRPLSKVDTKAVLAEAEHLLTFIGGQNIAVV